ncbi:MAG: GIY-YIG nuclease family protein [Cytophagales bacterium]|nr:GIY-YIG nuclease family protein [Cytophagales bacterium]
MHSQAFDKIYIGYSADLEKRIQSHNTLATKGWTVIDGLQVFNIVRLYIRL